MMLPRHILLSRIERHALLRLLAVVGTGVVAVACEQDVTDEAVADGAGLSTGWVECATENGRCNFTGTRQVRYGTTKRNVIKAFTGGIDCNNSVFGDPVVGVLKKCWYAATIVSPTPAPTLAPASPPASSWVLCASEGGMCTFTGTRQVRYGTEARNVIQTKTDGVSCTNQVFGDPAVGVLKSCWYSTPSGTTPPPTTPTTPPPTTPPTTGTAGPRVTTFTSSGPITASAGQTISGVRITNPNGPCITIPSGAVGVTIRDSDIGPCGAGANILVQGANATIEYSSVHEGKRGVLASNTSGVTTRLSTFTTFYGPKFDGTAIEYDYMSSGTIDANVIRGSNYASDVVSVFESSNVRVTNNDIDVNIAEPSAAAFTTGDSSSGNPGSNNYVAGNVVKQTGGVPAGVFGSSGNTILEKNCLTAGIQAYNYSGVFVGVTVRNNVINMGASFVPDSSVISGWSTNINSTDCSKVPK